MKKILWNLAVAMVAVALVFASCSTMMDVDPRTEQTRQSINIMAEGDKLKEAGSFRLALDRYNKALALAPSAALYYNIGSCYYSLGEFAKSYESLQRAILLAEDYPAAQYLLSQVRVQLALAQRRGATPIARATPPRATVRPTAPPPGAGTPVATRPPTPRVVASATPTPLERTPRATTPPRVPTPLRATPTPVPTRPRPTFAPRPTTARTIIPTPPESVEPLRTPDTRVRPNRLQTPKPTPGGLPVYDKKDVFRNGETEDIFEPTGTGSLISVDGLLGKWQFHMDKAQSYLERKPPLLEEAVAELLRVVGARPTHIDAHLLLGDTYDKLGRGEKALDQYEEARVFASNQPKPYFRTGNYYLRHTDDDPENFQRASRYYFKALSVDPNYYFAYHNLGIAYMKQGDFARAQKSYLAALKIKPDYASAYRNLGILYEQHLNKPKEAIQCYERYIQLGGPGADEIREWIRALRESLP